MTKYAYTQLCEREKFKAFNDYTSRILLSPFQYPAQVCRFGMLFYWTKECEQGVAEIKYDRKALNNTSKKFGSVINKLPVLLMRGTWKNVDETMTPIHKIRLERMVTVSIWYKYLVMVHKYL